VLEAHLAGDQLEEVRSRPPLFVAPDAPLWVAIRTMQDARVTCLLVGDRARLDGILTERNLLMRAAGSPLDRVRVADIMTPEPVVLRGADTIATAIHTMAVGGFRHVPLVEAGRIVGIVTAGDLFRHILRIVA
jgi:CBS domain-containing protein